MTLLTPDEIAAIVERNGKRTPGEWTTIANSWNVTSVESATELICRCDYQGDEEDEDAELNTQHDKEADFIAHCSTDIPCLLHDLRIYKRALIDVLDEAEYSDYASDPDWWLAQADNKEV